MVSHVTLEKLEFSKILNQIVRYCTTETGKNLIISLRPHNRQSEAIAEGELVNQAKEILIKNVYPPIEFIPDLRETIAISRIEGTLIESKKILDVLRLAVMSRNLRSHLKANAETAPSFK